MRTKASKAATLTICFAAYLAIGVSVNGICAELSPAAKYFPDAVLVNQNGEEMQFYSDLVQGKVVVINTIFTTCTGICPVMSKTYTRLQDHLGERLGRDVHLISISVDPENDTPERLKAFGDAFGAREGWYLLTGEKKNIDLVLYKLGHYVEEKESHTAIMLMGNESTGLWKKAFGLADSEELATILDSVLNDTLQAEGTD
jgi:protein SCO1/2